MILNHLSNIILNHLLQVKLCGHATLATTHTLFSSGLVDTDVIKFVTISGVLAAKKIPAIHITSASLAKW